MPRLLAPLTVPPAAWLLVFGWFAAGLAWGQVTMAPQQVQRPAKGMSKNSGLQVVARLDDLGPRPYGYSTLTYEFRATKPVTSETHLTVRASLADWDLSRAAMKVEGDGKLEIGDTQATVTLRMPQTTEWQFLWWDVWVDGGHDATLSQDNEPPVQLAGAGNRGWQSRELLIWDANPHNPVAQFGISLPGIANPVNRSNPVQQRRLSTEWLDYTPFDVVVIDRRVLKVEVEQQAEAVRTLERWVRSGGNLWIETSGPDWEGLEEIEGWLNMPAARRTEPLKPDAGTLLSSEAWSFVNLTPEARDGQPGRQSRQAENPNPFAVPPIRSTQDQTEPQWSENWFVARQHGWGTVAAYEKLATSPPGRFTRDERRAARIFWTERAWPSRHGIVPGTANAEFSNWLIPGVGLAPVVGFQVLITLFVLGIGPLNYWLLKRAGRLQFVVLTVPVVALVITGGLLLYGLVADGFATRVRTQSITLLDQPTGAGATWSRLSYYAAFAPQHGLTFPRDAAVYAIQPGANAMSDLADRPRQQEIHWTDTEQRLTRGWLPSRTPTQYLAIQPRQVNRGLDFTTADGRLAVENHFAAAGELLLAVDTQGKWHVANEVPTDRVVSLSSISRTDAVAALRELLMDRAPEFPPGFDAAQDSPLLQGQQAGRQSMQGRSHQGHGFASLSENLLEKKWQALLGLSGGEPLDLPAGSYVLVSDRALLPISRDGIGVEEASVHLVVGRWERE